MKVICPLMAVEYDGVDSALSSPAGKREFIVNGDVELLRTRVRGRREVSANVQGSITQSCHEARADSGGLAEPRDAHPSHS